MSSPEPAWSQAPRVLGAGFLMGLANLVPGVSGGTMVLALGLYDRFVQSLALLTRLRPTRSSLLFLALLGAGAVVAILALSGVAVELVTRQRWVMYSIFIGMTLGGAPELLRLCRPVGPAAVIAFALALGAMAMLAWGLSEARLPQSVPVLCAVGAVAASSMILPGVSGSYMLLLFGMYDVVLGAVRPRALMEEPVESLRVLVPVGVGVVLGIALLSNLLRFLLTRLPSPSHAALLGLLVGSVLGLWPFRAPANPELADPDLRRAVAALLAGEELRAVNARRGVSLSPSEADRLRATWAGRSPGDLKRLGEELEPFTPTPKQVAGSVLLFAAGFALTRLLGRRRERPA
jgi:putative membrane protein